MKNVLSLLTLLLLIVACGKVTPPASTGKNILDSIPKEKPVLEEKYTLDKAKFAQIVDVTFNNGTVQHSQLPQGVYAQTDGKNIRIVSQIAGVEFRLAGQSNDGSFAIASDSSVLVTLNGLALASRTTPMKIECRKVAYLQCTENTTNYLMDTHVEGDTEKNAAAIETIGEIVMCGGGKLALCGKRRYAMHSNGRLLINDITIVVENSVHDAISTIGGIAIIKGNLNISSTKDAIKAKKGNVLFFDGNVLLNPTGEKGDGIQAENIYMYGSNISIKTKGDASRGFNAKGSVYILDGVLSVLSEGGATFASKKADYSSNACIKCEKELYIGGGYLNLENNATAGKGINCNGKLQMNDGILLVRNYGEDIVHPTIADAHASAKGIKCDSTIAINGGKVEVLVFGNGERCEGMESKDEIYISGDANIYVYASDDAINSGGNLIMNSGKLYAYSANNDAIDGNKGIIINGGTVIANGSGSPEQGIDCDFDGNLRVTGGTIVSIGGLVGDKPNIPRNKLSTQQSVVWSGTELQRDKFINLCNDKGEVILSYKLPRSLGNAGVLISSPLLRKESTYTLSTSNSATGSNHMGNGLFTEGKCLPVEDAKSFTIEELITKIDDEGNIEAIAADTTDITKRMMPPPFGMGGGGPGMPPPFEGIRGKDEGYNVNNLPGGGW